jgi:hypothetical protein
MATRYSWFLTSLGIPTFTESLRFREVKARLAAQPVAVDRPHRSVQEPAERLLGAAIDLSA